MSGNVGEWQRYTVELGSEYGSTQIETREVGSTLEWRGLPGTTLETWNGGGPRTGEPIAAQVQQTAYEWFHNKKMK